jgi:pimeloyl-ACP methyl ester carboxylesterase
MTPHPISRGYVDGLWGQVHYRRCGEGPAVLLLHQTSVSGRMFEAGMPALAARGFRAIALDTPGYGQSDRPGDVPSMADYAENLALVVDALGLARPHILGHHTGAGIAAIHGARRPERLDRLVMQGVPWFDADTLQEFAKSGFQPFIPRPDGGHLVDAWKQRLAISPGWSDIAAMHRHTVDMLSVNCTYFEGFEAALAHDLEPDLKTIRAPTLLLINTGDSAYQLTRRTAELRTDFAYEEHPGGTNDFIDEQPELWADAVAAFLSACG